MGGVPLQLGLGANLCKLIDSSYKNTSHGMFTETVRELIVIVCK